MQIGIFGGAFDPFHKEHKKLIEAALGELNLDKILVIPSVNPPHKAQPIASFADREAIIKAQCEGLPYITVSPIEHNNPNGYTHLTLQLLKEVYPQDKLIFIIGADSLLDFGDWKSPDKIAALASLAVAGREGYRLPKGIMDKISKKHGIEILPLNYTGREISSTGLRAALALGANVGNIIGEAAKRIIAEKGLYELHKDLVNFVSANISEDRFAHTQRTVLFALELNKQAQLPFDNVFLAALLHDVAKTEEQARPLAHQYEGERIAKERGITDKSILRAIRYHATGSPDMDKLGKIIYLADKLEPGRDYKGVQELRKLALKDYQLAFEKVLEANINNLIKSGITPDANSLACMQTLRRK